MVRETPCAAACLGSSENHALICWSRQSSPEVIISGPSFVCLHLAWTVLCSCSGIHEPRRATLDVVRRCFEAAGIEFIDENGGGPGVRLKKPHKKRT